MIPKIPESLGHLGMRIAADLAPKAADAYTAADMGLMAILFAMIGQDVERFAEVRVREDEAMKAIFSEAAPHLADPSLTARIGQALETRAASLAASDLDARADLTLRLLIDLHAAVEAAMDRGEAWAGAINDRIWTFLDAYAAGRAYAVPVP